ncbi:L-rhamnose-binding lectin CSL2-like [Stegastes partitus]|uniref:L-rhamnose-binding lectin CSL2-like n=1 Tax=Stegastes partitus TaxID=144197 RepID=A0A3B5B3S7_9TELE|nr:PREDICTED: L-rhamnose-binding lectin CSL2-like [Stegastes partitus]
MTHLRLSITLLLPLTWLLAAADISSDIVATCQDEVQQLTCAGGGVIWVQAALYGRSDSETCSEGTRPEQLRDTSCSLPGTDSLVGKRCNGKRTCQLSSSLLHKSEPCVGTFKYLQTNYTCLPAIHLILCEHSETHLHCAEGQVISVVGADYGRRDRTTCSYKRPASWFHNDDCWAPTSKVAESCNGRSSCRIRASNSMFGDPCPGTYKYLEVSYVCQKSV